MNNPQSMSDRLKHARMNAGYKTATAAINKLNWNGSTYRAHENGQNNFNVSHAEKYAKAYGVSAAWLLVGDLEDHKPRKQLTKQRNPKCKKNECPDKIYALAVLLRDDPDNTALVEKLVECVKGYSAFF